MKFDLFDPLRMSLITIDLLRITLIIIDFQEKVTN